MYAINLVALHPAWAITIDTVPIGNPGNGNDPATGNLYGGVAYNYSIGKYDVTVGQYTAFLNAVAATDTYGFYNSAMATDPNIAGVSRSGAPGSYSYGVIGSPNKPVTYISWGDAVRFCNWLQNGQPGLGGSAVPQNAASTEAGAYEFSVQPGLIAVSRSAKAQWFIPSESEWYKAAYHKNDGITNHYWNYATGTNTTPTSAPPGNTLNTANFYGITTGYAVTGSTSHDSKQNYLTDVGSYTASASPYGTFDQSGDVSAYPAIGPEGHRGMGGGLWDDDSSWLASTSRGYGEATAENDINGFRVATVLEPSTVLLGALGAIGLLLWRGVEG